LRGLLIDFSAIKKIALDDNSHFFFLERAGLNDISHWCD